MLPFRIDHSQIREKILGESVRDVATDLRLIDLPDLVSYLKTGQIASVSTLVQASIELSFKPETLTFGHAGDVYLEWGINAAGIVRHGVPPPGRPSLLQA